MKNKLIKFIILIFILLSIQICAKIYKVVLEPGSLCNLDVADIYIYMYIDWKIYIHTWLYLVGCCCPWLPGLWWAESSGSATTQTPRRTPCLASCTEPFPRRPLCSCMLVTTPQQLIWSVLVVSLVSHTTSGWSHWLSLVMLHYQAIMKVIVLKIYWLFVTCF